MDVLITYDIDTTTPAGARRLQRVAHLCESYGQRVQDSVFECRLSAAALQRLIVELGSRIDVRFDSVNLYRFEGSLAAARTSLGRHVEHELGRPWVL
ncbi:MAG TPA: CRISPR-associated endonuclease Cas2 [Candidatus Dormibacteraeota bacterium]|nr:CRISPR-associated endonuclease Cas2 [Candidatus Dormibacteraeota bacterium]